MKIQRSLKEWALLITLATMWGSSYGATKIAVAHIPPMWTVFLRLILACAVLLVISALAKQIPKIQHGLWLFLLACTGLVAPFLCISWGQQLVNSSVASILIATTPLFVLPLAHLFTQNEKINIQRGLGFVMGFLGVFFLFGPTVQIITPPAGYFLVFVSQLVILMGAVCYASNVVLAWRGPRAPPLQLACGVTLMSVVISCPLAFLSGPLPPLGEIPPEAWLATAFLGLFPAGLAVPLFFLVVQTSGTSFTALGNYFTPLIGVGIGALFMNETLTWYSLLGLLFILAGCLVAESRMANRKHD